MYRLVAIAVFWAAAVLPQTAFAQSHGVRSAGPVAGIRMSPSAPTMHMAGPAMLMPDPGAGVRMRGPAFGPGVRMRGPGFAPPVRMSPVRRMPAGPGGRHVVFVRPPFHGGFGFGHHSHFAFFSDRCFNDPFFDPFFCHQFFIDNGFIGAPLLTTPFFAPPIYSSEPVAQQTGPSPAEAAQESDLENRIELLTEDVEQLRAESAERQAPTPTPPPGPIVTELPVATVLVFRDGHRETVHNYAVAGKTLWVFTEYRAKKISTSELDLTATKKMNSDRGVEFLLPGLH